MFIISDGVSVRIPLSFYKNEGISIDFTHFNNYKRILSLFPYNTHKKR